jgi:polyhydroxyalkanoate synthesis regulator phasin
MPGLRMSKAPQEHIVRLRTWMQFNEELCEIDPEYKKDWDCLKQTYENEDDYLKIIKHCEDGDGEFKWEFYMDYFRANISHIYMRIIIGFEILLDNCCDPDLDYLDFTPEIKKALELLPSENLTNTEAKNLSEEIKHFCKTTDEEMGEQWSNDFEELPSQIEKFVKQSKFLQAEKLRAQIDVHLQYTGQAPEELLQKLNELTTKS